MSISDRTGGGHISYYKSGAIKEQAAHTHKGSYIEKVNPSVPVRAETECEAISYITAENFYHIKFMIMPRSLLCETT